MTSYSDSNENKISKIFNYLHLFFLSSIYFAICNILLITSVYLFEIKFYNLFIFFISSILSGPALVALSSFTNKIIYDEPFGVTKEFFKGYKKNFIISLKLWLPLLIVAFIAVFDLKLCFVNSKFLFLIIPLTIMLVVDIVLMSYSLVIISKYNINTIDTIKLSFYLLIKNPFTSIINLVIILLAIFILMNSKSIITLFVISIACFLMIKNMKHVFFFIENKYLK